jgi:hypothetical protein
MLHHQLNTPLAVKQQTVLFLQLQSNRPGVDIPSYTTLSAVGRDATGDLRTGPAALTAAVY